MTVESDIAQLVPVVESRFTGGWSTEDLVTNPILGEVIADTGELDAGNYDAHIWVYNGNAGGTVFLFQHRNAANDANVREQVTYFTTLLFKEMVWLKNYPVGEGERLRIIINTAFAGNCQGSIFGTRRI